MAVTGDLLAEKMGINPRFLSPIEIYYPSRTKRISLANPTGALESIKVFPAGLVSVNDDIDKGLLIISIDKMRELLKYENEVSGVEIRLVEGTTEKVQKKIQKEIQEKLGPEYIVKNRLQQNEVLYKMMKYEKIATYMVLFFAIIIIAFNIFGSLTMLIIEKRDDIQTLRHLGAEEKTIKNIFTLEGWLISLTGMAAGLVIGIVFALIQQHFGIIKMPGHFVVQAYPIILSVSDILFTAIGVAIIGYIIALIPSRVREL